MTRASLLLLSPEPDVPGGVAAFASLLAAHLPAWEVERLWVGSNPNRQENKLKMAWRLCSAPLKAAWKARRKTIIHLNPSLNAKALWRDGLILLALRLSGGGPVIVFFHGWQAPLIEKLRRRPVLKTLFTRLFGGAERICVLSADFKIALESLGIAPERIQIGRTLFDGAALKLPVAPAASTRRTILFLSRFVREKGMFELLDAFARVAPDFPDTDLILAGDGPEADALKARAAEHNLAERVQFPGYVTGERKWTLLHHCSIYALPTWFPEGMPVALLEAMAAGKPLLTAKAGAIASIIREPDNGTVLESVTSFNVERALRRLLNDPDYCKKVGQRNAAYAWQHFEAAAVAAEMEKTYRELARA